MVYNSFEFLWLFPILWVTIWMAQSIINHCYPTYQKIGNAILLTISYGLYLRFQPEYALILLWVTAISYCGAKVLDNCALKCRKTLFLISICLTLLPLCFFKYWVFLGETLSSLLNLVFGCELHVGSNGLDLVLPVGLSFYTLQALGYMSDVYLQKIESEKNWWDYMLFIAFFPQILSGPISRAGSLLPQIKAERKPDRSQFVRGFRYLLWGMFMKVVLADRIGIYVDTVLDNYQHYAGPSLTLSILLYAFQIYGDFAGYSYMAIGAGDLLGFKLTNNFQRPYLSQNITEFWHRWHISLSTWLRDYVYIPLGGSRCSRARNYLNIIITFLVSGIWHGANWTYIIWGLLHGIIQVIEKVLGIHSHNSRGLLRCLRIVITFCIVSLLWLLFRMPTIKDACSVLQACSVGWGSGITSMTKSMGALTLMAASIVAIKDIVEERRSQWTGQIWNKVPARMAFYVVIICLILTCGVLDNSQFIYVRF